YRGDYGWTGRLWVAEVGLQYNRARFYDPGAGRWTSQDPEGFAAGDSDLYRYAGNAPTHATDPSGHYLIPLDSDGDARRDWLEANGIKNYAVALPKGFFTDRRRWYVHIYKSQRDKMRQLIERSGYSEDGKQNLLAATVTELHSKSVEMDADRAISWISLSD